MVRKCIVSDCTSSDIKILCHRFPTRDELASKWVNELGLDITKYTKNELKKYVVCSLHFDKKDYKNEVTNSLNITAIPKLFGHEPREQKSAETNTTTTSCYEISIVNNDNYKEEIESIVKLKSAHLREEDYCSDISFGVEGLPEMQKKICRTRLDIDIMDTSIIECTESEISRLDEDFDDNDINITETDNDIYLNNEISETQHLEIQQYDSDVEIIDYNEALDTDIPTEELDIGIVPSECLKNDKCGNSNLSETVSLISSIAEADEDDIPNDIVKTYADAACQSDPVEIYTEHNDESEDEEYKNKSRKDLIELIKEQKMKIIDVDKKLKEFQATHVKLVQSMDAFKILLTKEIDKNMV